MAMKDTTKTNLPVGPLALLGLAALLFGGACDRDAPTAPAYIDEVSYFVGEGQTGGSQLGGDLRRAESRIWLAVTALDLPELSDLLIEKHEAGVDVRVVGDEDERQAGGFARLLAAGVPVHFADGELRYLPDPTLTGVLDGCSLDTDAMRVRCNGVGGNLEPAAAGAMVRPGSFNLMSHHFAVIDETTVWSIPVPTSGASAPPVGFRLDSEWAAEAFSREFNQLFVGVDAINLDQYNGPNKSDVQHMPRYMPDVYPTDQGDLTLLFNPQERLVKTVIDEVYRARSSVWIMSDALTSKDLFTALDYKRLADFDVRVIVHAEHQPTGFNGSLAALGARQITSTWERLPTVVIVDDAPDRTGTQRARRVMVLSHPLWRSAPFDVSRPQQGDDVVDIFPADNFVDGHLWSLNEYRTSPTNETINRFVDLYEQAWQAGKEL